MFTGNNTSVAINYAIIYNFVLSKEPDLLERFTYQIWYALNGSSTLQHFECSNTQRNNVRFLPRTATYIIIKG